MREWLTIIIGLLILAVVLDGIRRMRQVRRNRLRMPRRTDAKEDSDLYSSELPNGGARVKTRAVREQHMPAETARVPQQVSLNLEEHVPTLMEVEPDNEEPGNDNSVSEAPRVKTDRIEPTFSTEELDEDHPDVVLGLIPARGAPTKHSSAIGEQPDPETLGSETPLSEVIVPDAPNPATPSSITPSSIPTETFGVDMTWDEEDFSPAPNDEVSDDEVSNDDMPDDQAHTAPQREPDEVLIINVMAAAGERLYGDLLLETVLEQGMRFGEMNIFHHHEKANGSGALLYSMANMLVPGTFDLETMREFATPGVSLFLSLPSGTDSAQAFETMLDTAQAIATQLGAELKDENRSVMTPQTIEHYRSRIKEFERKQLSKASSLSKAPL